MRHALLPAVLVLSSVPACAAEDPCVAFCDAVRAADCADPYTERCDRECGIGRDLDEECSEEYSAQLECLVDQGIACEGGRLAYDYDACEAEHRRDYDCLGLE